MDSWALVCMTPKLGRTTPSALSVCALDSPFYPTAETRATFWLMKAPNWLLWLLAILGVGSLARFPFIDWGADLVYSATTLLLFGLCVAAAMALHRRGAFNPYEETDVPKTPSDD